MKYYVNTFKSIICTLVLVITFSTSNNGYSQEDSMEKPYLLWKVSGDNLKKPSYIFGVNSAYQTETMLSELKEILITTEQLVLDMKKENTPEENQKIQKLIVNEAGAQDFYNQFDKETQGKLDTFFTTNYGADFKRLSAYKPFMVLNLITSKVTTLYDITGELTNFSKTENKTVVGLETIEEQINEFDKIPISEQAITITELIKDLEEAKQKTNKITEYYKTKDIMHLYEELQEFKDTETGRIMLESRNRKWMPKLTKLIEDKSSFIAIGVTHMLPFKGNLKSLLEAKGYKITLME